MPAEIPAARKPSGAVTPWVRTSRVLLPIPRSRRYSHDGKPSVSGQPSARFIDCTAAPPVPLTRLSIAQTATNMLAVFVDGDRDVRGVAADHRAGLRKLTLGQQMHERL